MKKIRYLCCFIASIVLLSGCEPKDNNDATLSTVDERITSDSAITVTKAETSVITDIYTLSEAASAEQPVSETESTAIAEVSASQTSVETTIAVTENNAEIEEIISEEVIEENYAEIIDFDDSTEEIDDIQEDVLQTAFYFEPENDYASRFVENLTGDDELYELFNDALYIYRELYTGIGMTSSKVFKNHGDTDKNTGLVSTGVAYSDYKEFLGLYFTDDFIAELGDKEFIVNVDGEVYYNDWFMGARGGEFFFNGAELRISEKTDDLITLKLKIHFRDESDPESTRTVRTDTHRLYVVKTDDGWRFDDMHYVC